MSNTFCSSLRSAPRSRPHTTENGVCKHFSRNKKASQQNGRCSKRAEQALCTKVVKVTVPPPNNKHQPNLYQTSSSAKMRPLSSTFSLQMSLLLLRQTRKSPKATWFYFIFRDIRISFQTPPKSNFSDDKLVKPSVANPFSFSLNSGSVLTTQFAQWLFFDPVCFGKRQILCRTIAQQRDAAQNHEARDSLRRNT